MYAVTKTIEPFPGWGRYREVAATLESFPAALMLMQVCFRVMQDDDGVFVGDGLHNYDSHHVLARVLLRQWLDAGAPSCDPGTPWPAVDKETYRHLFSWSNDLTERDARARAARSEEHPPGSTEHFHRISEAAWEGALKSRLRNASPKFEQARAWALLRHYWPAARNASQTALDRGVRDPLDTAFESSEHYLFLTVALHRAGGWIPDPVTAFAGTALGDVESFLQWYVPLIEDVVGDWATIEGERRTGLVSAFVDEPIVRLPDGGLLAPDPGLLWSGIEERLSRRARAGLVDNHGADLVGDLWGAAIERYVQDLVRDAAAPGPGSVLQPFSFGDPGAEIESPDVPVSAKPFVGMEVKATRWSEPYEDALSLNWLCDWLEKVLGRRTSTGRGPWEQGSAFFEAWRAGSPEIVAKLGPFPGYPGLVYAVVTPEIVPFAVHVPAFRKKLLEPGLTLELKALSNSTVFLAIDDLEVAATIAEGLGTGSGFDVVSELVEWKALCETQRPAFEDDQGRKRLLPRFGDFLVEKYPEAASGMPARLQSAMGEFWDAAAKAGFGQGLPGDDDASMS